MARNPSIILISGSSHVGKTTLAKRLGQTLDWPLISTDDLARHPGRPWPQVRDPVAEFYSRLSPETIHWFLKVHHENMWPNIKRLIDDTLRSKGRVIVEGSALRPEYAATCVSDQVVAVCLYAQPEVLRDRMRSESDYAQAEKPRIEIIDSFIDRSLRDNAEIRTAAETHGLRSVDASEPAAASALFDELVSLATVHGLELFQPD